MTAAPERDDRPFPPGEYPVVVVGSGPGATQVAYFLSRLGIEHAVISGDPGPGGMFRRWPFFQRLLSWTKPYLTSDRHSRAYERWDWNSPLAMEPELRGIELAVHYADTRAAETYAGKRLFIIGKQNSGFELATGLLQWASRITLSSPSPAKTSIETRSLVGVRARYVQPFEDSALGGGVDILSASLKGISRSANGLRVDLE